MPFFGAIEGSLANLTAAMSGLTLVDLLWPASETTTTSFYPVSGTGGGGDLPSISMAPETNWNDFGGFWN